MDEEKRQIYVHVYVNVKHVYHYINLHQIASSRYIRIYINICITCQYSKYINIVIRGDLYWCLWLKMGQPYLHGKRRFGWLIAVKGYSLYSYARRYQFCVWVSGLRSFVGHNHEIAVYLSIYHTQSLDTDVQRPFYSVLLSFLNMGRERQLPRWIKKALHIGFERLWYHIR